MNLINGRLLGNDEALKCIETMYERMTQVRQNGSLTVQEVIGACGSLSDALGESHVKMLITRGTEAAIAAREIAEAKLMLEAAQRTGKNLTIGYQSRHRANSQYLKRAADNGELGEIYFAKANARRRRAVPTWGVFLNEYEQGGGPLIDIGTHALDLTLWIMNNYKPKMVVGTVYKKLGDQTETANAWGDWDPKEYTVEDSAFGFIVMENGATIELESSWALNTLDVEEATTTVCGVKGGADMKDGLRINGVKYGKQYVEKPDLSAGGVAFYNGVTVTPELLEAKRWIDAVVNDTEVYTKPEEAIVVTRILEAIYESAKTGKPVYFD